MPFAKRGDVVHSEATSGFNNQKKSLLINGLAALGDSLYPLQFCLSLVVLYSPLQLSTPALRLQTSLPTSHSYSSYAMGRRLRTEIRWLPLQDWT